MIATASRPLLRRIACRSNPVFRSASTSAPESSAGLDKVQKVFAGAAHHGTQAYEAVTKRAGNALGAYKEPLFYNAAVAKELLKQVYVAEGLAPPTLAQVTQSYATFFKTAQSPSYWKQLVESGEWKRYGLYAIEAYGIFKIGEMIGRQSLVGYSLDETKPIVA